MNRTILMLVFTLALTPALRAQTPPPNPHAMPDDDMHRLMMATHQHELDGLKADLAAMKLSLAQMKANVPQITDSAEKARWQTNVDLWEALLAHMQKMAEHMDMMGSGMMHGHGASHDHDMGAPPPPADKKQEYARRPV